MYPNKDYNTFIDLPEADKLQEELNPNWYLMPADTKKLLLVKAFRFIEQSIDLTGNNGLIPVSDCMKRSQAEMSNYNPTKNKYNKAKVGPISVEYQETQQDEIPSGVVWCLKKYGFSYNPGLQSIKLQRS